MVFPLERDCAVLQLPSSMASPQTLACLTEDTTIRRLGCDFQHSSPFGVVTIGKFEDSYEGLDSESLHYDGKDNHAERQVQDLLAIGKRGGQAQRKSERQCSAEPAPYGHMLPTKRNLLCALANAIANRVFSAK